MSAYTFNYSVESQEITLHATRKISVPGRVFCFYREVNFLSLNLLNLNAECLFAKLVTDSDPPLGKLKLNPHLSIQRT
jgi:hypothetical protein